MFLQERNTTNYYGTQLLQKEKTNTKIKDNKQKKEKKFEEPRSLTLTRYQ